MRVPIRLSTEDTGGAYPGALDMKIQTWLKHTGDTVNAGDELATVNTEKTTITLHALVSGVLVEITIRDGEDFMVQKTEEDLGRVFYTKTLGYIETTPNDSVQKQVLHDNTDLGEKDATGEAHQTIEHNHKTRFTPLALRMLQGKGVSTDAIARRFPGKRKIDKEDVETFLKERKQNDSPANKEVVSEDNPPTLSAPSEDIRAVPAARRLAKEKGLDICSMRGTGPDGIITLKDVERASGIVQILSKKTTHEPKPAVENDEWEIIQPSPLHLSIARHMQEGWKTPTAQPTLECDLSKLVWFKMFYAEKFERTFGVKLRLTFPFVAALVRTLSNKEVSQWFNGYWDAKNPNEPIFKYCKNVHLGISLNNPDGKLVILVVHGANKLSTPDLARELENIGQKAQTGKYTLLDATGFTFIFNNIGALATFIPEHLRGKIHVVSGYSLLPPNISALLNLSTIETQSDTKLQLSFDHRSIMGGYLVTKFFVALYEELERVLMDLQMECDKIEKTNV